MCGIAGHIGFKPSHFDMPSALKAMTHRGPDFGAQFTEVVGNSTVQLGHRRLSIIDLSNAGNQPMHQDGVSLVYNGEVYNYQELKSEHLKQEQFLSDSDTEVVLKLYIKFGADFVHLLNGDFAMAILDRNRNEVLLIRDRLGVKPLYLHRANGCIAFASEIKAFSAAGLSLTRDESEVGNFLVFKYTPLQRTLYKEVNRLPPGHTLTIDLLSGVTSESKYWDISTATKPFRGSYTEACELLRAILKQAVERRLVADVPIASYLSGGLDSSIIAWHIRHGKHTHYCAVKEAADLRMEGTTDDGFFARKLAEEWGLNFQELPIGLAQLTPEHMKRAVWACDDLIADGSIIPAMLIAEQAAQSHRVVLSGMGADEIFLGYNGHLLLRLTQYASAIPGLKSLLAPMLRSVSAGKGPFKAYRRYLQKWGNNLGRDFEAGRFSIVGDLDSAVALFKGAPRYAEIFEPYFGNEAQLWEGLLMFETDNFLVKNLHYLDRSSMAFGLESRVPYLDHELVEFAAGLPLDYKLSPSLSSKRILKDAYLEVLPRYITQRRKAGFGMPLRSLLANKDALAQLLPEGEVEKLGCIDMDQFRSVRSAHISGRMDQSALLYALITLIFSPDR